MADIVSFGSPNLLVMTEGEAARQLRISEATLRRQRLSGTGPRHVRLSTRRLGYRASALAEWLARQEVGGSMAA